MYYEDIEVGSSRESEQRYRVTADEIKRFAGEFDPLPFHLDEAAARAYPMGALCASSLHTIALGTKLTHAIPRERETAIIAGLGWDEVRFPVPVFADDVLYVRTSVVSKRESKSDPSRGVMVTRIEILKQDGTLAASFEVANLVLRRPA